MNEPHGSFLMDKDMETRRGTTPQYQITLDGISDASIFDTLWITMKQGAIELTKTLDDIFAEGNVLTIRLTQEETLAFKSGSVSVQMRGLIGDEAVASDVRSFRIEEILKDGVIS